MLVHPKVSLLDRCISGQSCKFTNKGLYINSQADTSKGLNTSKGLSTNKITCICIPRLDITITKNYVVDIIKNLTGGKLFLFLVFLIEKMFLHLLHKYIY